VHRFRLVPLPFPWNPSKLPSVLLVTIVLFAGPRLGGAASISSRVLIDPAGESDGDTFGISVASVGDVNRDGYDDLVAGAHFYPAEGGRGRAYLFFGGPAIDTVADLAIPNPTGDNVAWFGISVASAGDFNGDGDPDIIVGARNSGILGKAYVFYGGPSLDATPDVTLTGESTGSSTWFGNSVASAGDLNGDGFDDVIVGAPAYGTQVGRVYVYYGGSAPDAVPDRVFTGTIAGNLLGWVVGSAGDLNGDGHLDVFATAPRYYSGGTDPGGVYAWFGGPGSDAVPDLTIRGSVASDRPAYAANAGDVNADGFSDLIVSKSGHAEVYFGGASPDAIPDLTIIGNFTTVAGAGDVNGDGIDDFMVGDPSDGTGGTYAGRVSVYFGGNPLDPVADQTFNGDRPGRYLGRSLAAARHVDGPGPADIIAGAAEDPEQVGYDRGRVYVFANSFATTDVPVAPVSGLSFAAVQPNPAVNDVNLVLALDHAVSVRVAVYDLAGHEVARPVADEWLTGRVTRSWHPRGLANGIYYVRAQLGGREQVRKLAWLGDRP